MPHWTDDPKIHALMTHLGKVGATGKQTRSAYVAGQVGKLMVTVEARMAERRALAKEDEELSAEYERLTMFVKERSKRERELRDSIKEARQEFLGRNPKADTRELDLDAQKAVQEFEEAQEKAPQQIEDLVKSVTMKRTGVRRLDDRIEHYRKQVYALLAQAAKGGQSAA
jgi:hypothetical protein